MRNIVILHGYTVGEQNMYRTVNREDAPLTPKYNDWYRVMWGEGRRLGRLPMALWLARHLDAHLIFTTGASRRASDGRWEAQLIYDLAQRQYDLLHAEFPHRFTMRSWNSREAYLAWLARVSSFDTKSKNTSECLRMVKTMIQQDILHRRERAMVYNVTSANHLPRVMRDAEVVFRIGESLSDLHMITLAGVPSETNYGTRAVSDTKVDDLGLTLKTADEWKNSGVRESE